MPKAAHDADNLRAGAHAARGGGTRTGSGRLSACAAGRRGLTAGPGADDTGSA